MSLSSTDPKSIKFWNYAEQLSSKKWSNFFTENIYIQKEKLLDRSHMSDMFSTVKHIGNTNDGIVRNIIFALHVFGGLLLTFVAGENICSVFVYYYY